MLRWSLRVATAILLLLAPASLLYGAIPVKVGVYNNKPIIFVDDDGAVRGLYIDILEGIAAEEDWQLEYIPGHFSEMFERLQAGTIDLLPAVAYSREREKTVDFTYETVMANWAELYTPGSVKISSIFELEGRKIAVKMGDIHFYALKDLLVKFNISCRFLETDEYATIFEMLQADYVTVGVVNRLYGNENKQEYGVQATPIIFNPIDVRFAVPEGKNEDIRHVIDTYLAAFKNDQNSVYHQAVNRWLVAQSSSRFPSWVLYLMYGVAGVTLFFFGVSLLLRYQVKIRTGELMATNSKLQAQIEERQRAEAELRKFARVVEASSDAMALLDEQHRHILANSSYMAVVAGSATEIEDKSIRDLVGGEFFDRELKDSVKKCLTGQVIRVQTKSRREQEGTTYWNVTLSPYYSQEGIISGYVIDIRDVASQVEMQNRLKNAHKMEAIGLLAGGVAHDLNNILSGIVSYPDMLLINRAPDDPMTVPLQTIKKSGERAAAIVQDLLTLARRGVGAVIPLSINEIAREFLDSPEYGAIVSHVQGIEVKPELDEDLLNIKGSSVHLSKILMNLVANAVEAMPGGGTLSIATQNRSHEQEFGGYEVIPAGEYAVLIVTDTGIGMSTSEVNRIFEPFYTSKILGRSGTGLGMAVVWGAIKDHSGFIDVKSTPGKGSCFSLYFPVTRESLPRLEESGIEHLRGNNERILVVDDMEEQRNLARQILELLGYQVNVASSGEEAVAICRKEKVDLLILDMIMPGGMDGLVTYEKICHVQPAQKAVIASGFSDTARVREAQQLGAGVYLKKPYTVKSLGTAVATELAAAE